MHELVIDGRLAVPVSSSAPVSMHARLFCKLRASWASPDLNRGACSLPLQRRGELWQGLQGQVARDACGALLCALCCALCAVLRTVRCACRAAGLTVPDLPLVLPACLPTCCMLMISGLAHHALLLFGWLQAVKVLLDLENVNDSSLTLSNPVLVNLHKARAYCCAHLH